MSDTCGATIDLYERDPGKLVFTCARAPHSTRVMHSVADKSFMWRDATRKKPAPKKPRGICPLCRREVAVRSDGTVNAHNVGSRGFELCTAARSPRKKAIV